MNHFKLKEKEIMIFVDFNKTLVDFENEYNNLSLNPDFEEFARQGAFVKSNLSKCLNTFEEKTGLTPVLCIVTNASSRIIDANNFAGIAHDVHMTFFDHTHHSAEQAKRIYDRTCERYFRYLIYNGNKQDGTRGENDFFFKINPLATSAHDMFVPYEFSEKLKQIKFIPQFRKKESVERMLGILDPNRDRVPIAIYAGDSIKDDYPMKLAQTHQGTCKYFIRPGRAKIMKPSLMYEFCQAKGVEINATHPRTGKKIKCFDEQTIKFLNETDRKLLENYSDGDMIYLTSENSRGLIEGIYKAMDDIIGSQKSKQIIF